MIAIRAYHMVRHFRGTPIPLEGPAQIGTYLVSVPTLLVQYTLDYLLNQSINPTKEFFWDER